MPVKVMPAPKGAEEVLRRGIVELAAADALEPSVQSVEGLESPVRVFVLDASALKREAPLQQARQVAWRYTLLDRRGEAIGFAELTTGTPGARRGSLALAQVGGGEAARSARTAMKSAEKLPAARGADYEARLLRFPAAYLTAVWLAPAVDTGHDWLVPVRPAPDGVEPNRAYSASDLLARVRPTVEKQLALKVSRRQA
ncbi:MAG TPA: hypothetical protein VLT62_25880 [Candidatus Methylomirabilis sp.]|nr:hypothetical protein [Candidatus Methylomirabilis sp.]